MRNHVYWLLMSAGLICGCATKRVAVMSEGEQLYRANCRSCHSLREPSDYSDEEWTGYVHRYGERIPLSVESERLIVQYLQSANN